MPGNQGIELRTTGANPERGMVFGRRNQVALLELEDVKARSGGREGGPAAHLLQAGAAVFQQAKQVPRRQPVGVAAGASLVGVTDRVGDDRFARSRAAVG
jgi:hypothetical protein